MQHAGYAHVVNIDELAGRLCRQIDARLRLPDDAVGTDRLHRNFIRQLEPDGLAGNQLAIADAAVILAADQAVFDGKLFDGKLQPLGRARGQKLPRLCRGVAQGDRRDLDGLAGDGRALVWNARGVAQYDNDTRKGHVEFFGDDLSERGANAGPKVDMTIESGDRAVSGYLDESFECALRARLGPTNHRQRSGPKSNIVRNLSRGHQSCASARRPAARIAARMISICAPHRHK